MRKDREMATKLRPGWSKGRMKERADDECGQRGLSKIEEVYKEGSTEVGAAVC